MGTIIRTWNPYLDLPSLHGPLSRRLNAKNQNPTTKLYATELLEHTPQCSSMIKIQNNCIVALIERIPTLQKRSKSVRCALTYCLTKVYDHQKLWICDDFGTAPHCLLLRTSITQCAMDGFASFLKHWNSLIEGYNMGAFDIYYIVRCVRVLEDFNCMLLGG